ncbi:MAG: RtcB family protein [Bacteroidetes bacterium]|nr:MAG: RtcB family protein [Bacteroidota bacterium]TAG86886.1 MAG: RtcB family protein [Bacteroidota bacterium]
MKRSEKLDKKELHNIGIYEISTFKIAGQLAKKLIHEKKYNKTEILAIFETLVENPDSFLEDEVLNELAKNIKQSQFQNIKIKQEKKGFELKTQTPEYAIYGKQNIEEGAIKQMDVAMCLPISVAGALMPDAHFGYGLPIGGVLATEINKIIPFAVGVDIACRMCMSIFPMEFDFVQKHNKKFMNLLEKNTLFGTGKGFSTPTTDDVFDRPEWKATKIIRELKSKAQHQIGTSGTGNHFVEWGMITILRDDNEINLPKGNYVALLSHSGSRGFGATIAGHYSKLAMEKTKLPDHAKHLAWLDMDTQEGQEYWIGMNLAGEYASANHHQIHKKMANDLEMKPLKIIENHHNFAWKEKLQDGTEVLTHRKGATPANAGEWGIIPGSMTAPGFLVKGKGNANALFSASHGAGRVMSRSQAFKQITKSDLQKMLSDNGVNLIGGDLDEAPNAYKNIREVMAFQSDLVEVIGEFYPKIVRMADKEKAPHWQKKKRGDLDFTES